MSQCVWYVSVGKTRFIDLSSLYTGQTGSYHSWMYVILCLSFFSWSSAKQTLMQPMNMGTHHCTMPASGAKTSWLRLALPLVVSHRRHLCPCFIFYFIMKPLSAVFRIWWLMGLLWAFVTNMGRLPWIKANLTCVNSSEVSHCALQLNAFQCLCSSDDFYYSSAAQKWLRKWDRTWLKFPSRTHSGKAPPELDPVSHTVTFYYFISVWAVKLFTWIFVHHISFCLGNGTLNKHAGVDYKQLSLLSKINENQSGEVLYVLVLFVFYSASYSWHPGSLYLFFVYWFLFGSFGKGAGKEMRLLLRC